VEALVVTNLHGHQIDEIIRMNTICTYTILVIYSTVHVYVL
jgi:hypothetical protein